MPKAILSKFMMVVALVCGLQGAAVADDAALKAEPSVLVQMFDWWNKAFTQKDGFTREGFARYFTPDVGIMIDGHMRVQGLDGLVTHFRGIQSRTEAVEIVTPFEEEFAAGDKIFTYHLIKSVSNGVPNVTHAMGYAVIQDGKIALIHLVRANEESREKVNALFDK